MKRASKLSVFVACASLLAACCALEPMGREIGKAIVLGILEPMVFVYTGTESVPGLNITEVWTGDPIEQHASLQFRLQAISWAEIDVDEGASPDEAGGRIRVRRLEVARRDGEPDTALDPRGVLPKDVKLLDGFDAWKSADREVGTPRYTLLHFFRAEGHELQERTLLLERVEPPERLGPHLELDLEVRRSNPAEPDDPECAGNDVLYFVGASGYTDPHAFRDRVSLLVSIHGTDLDRVLVFFSSNCTLGDFTATLQMLADLGVVDVLVVLLAEGQHGPEYWTE